MFFQIDEMRNDQLLSRVRGRVLTAYGFEGQEENAPPVSSPDSTMLSIDSKIYEPNHWAFLPTVGLIGLLAGTPPNCLLVCVIRFSPSQDRAVVISMFQVFEAFGGVLAVTITSAFLRFLAIQELRERIGTDPASEEMFRHFLEDVDYLSSVPGDTRAAMQAAYGFAAMRCCLIAFTSCIASILAAAILPRLDFGDLRSGDGLTAEVASNSEPDHSDSPP
ncbi:uncharacterized protein Z520_07545 [Fonsecaea multimorphosa CBS 102226]|uniref:Uncharacterized protein n=1 Tax=Fonsecaea multimorphosa CBS 102226 TaxID=1442371 RepID=A0A0D2H4S3_9EURO|nr:uncharacterized protein Z520_07545 [Fonsecaea multimorphosa CBS 102226]KIX96825.1 hypothetical protein Z520_07545 [Fonsecaea multimorphosa CBS 102226]